MNNFEDAVKYSFLSRLKTSNIILDTILSTVVLSALSYAMNYMYRYERKMQSFSSIVFYVKSALFKRYTLTIDGHKTISSSLYNRSPCVSLSFSNQFKAVWYYLLENMDKNDTITDIKEINNDLSAVSRSCVDNDHKTPTETDEHNMYIVSQKRPFMINHDMQIYAMVNSNEHENEYDGKKGENGSGSIRYERITIVLYSFHSELYKIKQFLQTITQEYLANIEKKRRNKKFIYMLSTTKYNEYRYECWSEHPFESTRTFQNMFFDGKENVLGKIDFFLNNRDWYSEMGIPYMLGIGLHGLPGTGKTSFIKALANKTGRHIVVLSLQMIKTQKQLNDFWYETQYSSNNRIGGIDFSDKIMVIEDIDCAGDIILKRFYQESYKTKENKKDTKNSDKKSNDGEIMVNPIMNDDTPIRLDDILNIIDGLRETPGRILILTSNHYDKLDDALVRPGRIDITVSMGKASKQVVQEMYRYYKGKEIPKRMLKDMEGLVGAEIMNKIV
jgi:ATP-dependent Zn protease